MDPLPANTSGIDLFGPTAQEWKFFTLIVDERVDCQSVVLPGSLLMFTEITEYAYYSLM